MANRRDALVQATKELLAEDGYTNTSPRDILARSGAGQGSLYHHFRGKSDLAATALREVSVEMRNEADAVLDGVSDPLDAVLTWVTAPRDALRGCRLGRLTAEPIQGEVALTGPLADFFSHVQNRLAGRLRQAQATHRLNSDLDAGDLASALVAVIQGGYVLARATGDPAAMRRAQTAAAALLRVHSLNPDVDAASPMYPEGP